MIWTNEFNVEVSLLDQQHKKLFHLMEELRLGLTGRMQHGKVDEIVSALTQYAEAHFLSEERLMQQTAYPEYERHKQEHDSMVGRVHRFQRDLDAGNYTVAEDLHAYLLSWFTGHILQTDKHYTRHFLNRGIR